MNIPIVVRPLSVGDIPTAMVLKRIAGWNQTSSDWHGYLDFAPGGCFMAEIDGRAVGTATTIPYGDRLGWVGMVLVHPDVRRHGVGTRLLKYAIDHLHHLGVRSIKLDATEMGKKVYVPMGFVAEYEVTRYEGTASPGSMSVNTRVEEFRETDTSAVAAYDAPLFGAGRLLVLQSLRGRNPEMCFLAKDSAGIRGYLIARDGANAVQLGPWMANDNSTAESLLDALLRQVEGRRIYVDAPVPNRAACALIERRGFAIQRGFTRMCLGENRHPGVPDRVFGTSGAEKG